ncbi:hypothetical protein [Microbacterium sp. NIBRBAC000506063]|uniref:hypothetical protein n=1 Tax=Microbacterium sp. NIBRBAC000506063 TaxID=2734618 RepID=UPI001BB4DC71|nr:hypothetical protein [Microbacterium sp. NIBRBAC000506063]QTV79654.1 hypothetical protein KAE78_12695 [Microbacterium sp. NIBRBAC000506063]
MRAAAAIPFGGVVLALYLRNLVNEAWALSWDHTLIRSAVGVAVSAAADQAKDDAEAVAWRLLDFMQSEFDVEAALLTGRLRAVITVSARATSSIEKIRRAAAKLAAHPGRDALIAETKGEHRYYGAIHEIATAAHALLSRDSDDASAALARIEAQIDEADFRAVDASELRGHLASLQTVNAAVHGDWVHVDEGRVLIVYGFGILHPRRHDGIEELTALRARLALRHAQQGRLGPLKIHKVLQSLALSDVWQGSDSLGRGFRGSTVQLEDLTLAGIGDDPTEEIIRTSIQFSELGNHAIVFEIDLEDAAAYEVAQTINLATPVFGDLTEIPEALHLHPRSDDDARISRLADVVDEVLDDLRKILHQVRIDMSRNETKQKAPPVGTDPISARAGSFGVIVTIEGASRDSGGVRTPLTSARHLIELWGIQPMLHPLPGGASGVADWTMYDVESVKRFDLLHLNDELLCANSNVTLLASFRSPDYALSEIESFLRFTHSMHGMYQAWQSTVRTHAELIARLLQRVEDELQATDIAIMAHDDRAQEEALANLGEVIRVIEREELALQSFVQSKQAIMLFVESPAIVTSPALRTDLDAILRSNRYDLLRDEFERSVRDVLGTRLQPLLEVCHRRIALLHESRQSERERRTERLAQVLGVILAVVGLSGLVQVLQDGLELRGDITWWFVAAILFVAVALGGVMIIAPLRLRRRRAAARRRRRASRARSEL